MDPSRRAVWRTNSRDCTDATGTTTVKSHKKRGDTQLKTLRKEYGEDLLKGTRKGYPLGHAAGHHTGAQRGNSLDQLLREEGKK